VSKNKTSIDAAPSFNHIEKTLVQALLLQFNKIRKPGPKKNEKK
jgi:hypothetical protein